MVNLLAPLQGAPVPDLYQGLRSRCSLTPGLNSLHAFSVHKCPNSRARSVTAQMRIGQFAPSWTAPTGDATLLRRQTEYDRKFDRARAGSNAKGLFGEIHVSRSYRFHKIARRQPGCRDP